MQNAVLRNLSLVVCQGPLPVVSVHDADYSADGVFIYYFTQAYVFDVEDEYAESDIPTTLIRSKADCPGIEVSYFLTVLLFVFAYMCSPKAFAAIILEINSNQMQFFDDVL